MIRSARVAALALLALARPLECWTFSAPRAGARRLSARAASSSDDCDDGDAERLRLEAQRLRAEADALANELTSVREEEAAAAATAKAAKAEDATMIAAPALDGVALEAWLEGVADSELLRYDTATRGFVGWFELEQPDGSRRRTPAEFLPWFGPPRDSPAHWRREQTSVMFSKRLALPLGLVLEEVGRGWSWW